MYILSLDGKEGKSEGAYALEDDDGDKALYLFEDEDDASRYAGLLEADDYLNLNVVEIDDEVAIEACNRYNYKYVIISTDDIVFPPYDYIQED
jgi:hypothetical protein